MLSDDAATPPTRHVAVCAFPFGSHAATLLHLVRRLASASASTPILFTFLSTEQSNASLFSKPLINRGVAPLDQDSSRIVPRTIPEGLPRGAIYGPTSPEQAIELFLRTAAETLRRAISDAEVEVGMPVGCVVSDAFLWFCGEIAAEKRTPWVPFWTAGHNSLAAHLSTDRLRGEFKGHVEARKGEFIDKFIPGFTNVTISDLPEGIVFGNLSSPFSQMLHKIGQALSLSTVVPINSFQQLDPEIIEFLRSKLPDLLNVAPLSLTSEIKPDQGCLTWLDGQDRASSVIYISFGTIMVPPKDEIVALAEALEATGMPFLWSLNDHGKSLLPEGFVERVCGENGGDSSKGVKGKIVPWAPQLRVLGHPSIGVFVTHCGWNSVLESLTRGVPMICRPLIGDHGLNRRFVESVWRVGVEVEGGRFTKAGVERALNRVLLGEEAEGMRERVKMMKGMAEEDARADGGSSIKDLKKLAEVVTGVEANVMKK